MSVTPRPTAPDSVLHTFHPAVRDWFATRFASPTAPQVRAWPHIAAGRHTLIAAPTGSGKTLAAFLTAIDGILRTGVEGGLPDETRVVYVSPLKALSNDVKVNLSEPLAEITERAAQLGVPEVEIRTLVRTGDTPQTERQGMIRRPPHILVTTPESLYLMLTAERSRAMLRTVSTVIVDEIHAVARDKRGSHLALSIERLADLVDGPLQRVGLSATQKPIEEIARFLVGAGTAEPGDSHCEIIDEGHTRPVDLGIEIPDSPLEAVMTNEVWEEIYDRLTRLIESHRTTLVFVNTRRLAERVTARLSDRLGPERIASHHGSLSKEKRLEAESRLKTGSLRALVATASLELGIDIGSVDLVCQLGSTRSIATLLQRVGRSGHSLGATPKGRLFPLSRDDLVECAALVRATRSRRLDRLLIPEKPLDILAQQIVAAAAQDWDEEALFRLVRRAYPYRSLTRGEFNDVVRMLADGFSTRRGRRGAHIHYDAVNGRIRGRRGARQRLEDTAGATSWLSKATGLGDAVAKQVVDYLDASRKALGVVPTQETLVMERFFDEAGGMQLVIHAPFGSRINRAWGLALRKRFCRNFNFELQAAASEDAIVLSLGPQHSFPLEYVFHYLRPNTVEPLLIQALLDAPMFQTRWRWNATRSLAVLRRRGGRRVPAPLQRMESEDLAAAVFPDQAACPENLVGDREIPDHPLVNQAVQDCLTEAMDLAGLLNVLEQIKSGRLRLEARDTTEPSPLAHEILNAKPYAFLDDAPLEERRTQAVATRRSLDVKTGDELARLDANAIARVRDEAWPDVAVADKLHDALLVMGSMTEEEGDRGRDGTSWRQFFNEISADGRAGVFRSGSGNSLWIAAERLPLIGAVFPNVATHEPITVPRGERREWSPEDAARELVRGRLEAVGPTTRTEVSDALGLDPPQVDIALASLEREGLVLRGRFTTETDELEWCERRLLARIHRYTLDRLRSEIEPVSAADFMRFLLAWQRVTPDARAVGPEGLRAALDLLEGYEVAAAGWETDVLPARTSDYDPVWLDALCLSGEWGWGGLRASGAAHAEGQRPGPIRSTPIALYRRERAGSWRALAGKGRSDSSELTAAGESILNALENRGASFFRELVQTTGLLRTEVERGLGELVARGKVTSDSYAGLRSLLVPSDRRPKLNGGRSRRPRAPFGVETAGRWAPVAKPSEEYGDAEIETLARQLLRRYGVVFRRLLDRESVLPPWRDLLTVYRRLEARGELRGGRFVGGFSGEQYALPEGVGLLRSTRRQKCTGELIAVSGADPLNLAGIITPGPTVPALATNPILFQDGVLVAISEGKGSTVRFPAVPSPADERAYRAALQKRRASPLVRSYLGQRGTLRKPVTKPA